MYVHDDDYCSTLQGHPPNINDGAIELETVSDSIRICFNHLWQLQ